MPITDDIACVFAAFAIAYAVLKATNYDDIIIKDSEKKKDFIHIQARRADSQHLDSYNGRFNEVVLDTTNWKFRRFDGIKIGGMNLVGSELYDCYLGGNLYFYLGPDYIKRLGGKRGIQFHKLNKEENSQYIGSIGEVIDVVDKKLLYAHDGKTPGGFPL